MSTKGNAARKSTAAQLGLEELELESAGGTTSTTIAEDQAPTSINYETTSAVEADDDLESAGSGPRVGRFYVIAPEKELRADQAELKEGQQIVGTYEGSYVGGEYNSRTHKVREADGTVSGLPSAGKLNKMFQFAPRGLRVAVIFEGIEGKFKNFEVKRPRSFNARVEANDPTLTKNYDWSPANYGKGGK